MKNRFNILLCLLMLVAACKKDTTQNEKLPLQVKGFWPNSGNAGTIVNIAGTGFASTAADNMVTFNGIPATVVDARDSMLVVLAPATGTTGMLAVETGGKKIEAGNYIYQVLTLAGISPANGPAGTNIAIRGAGFSSLSGPAKVTVNGKAAIITSNTDTLLVAAVPVAAGSGKVVVIVDGKEVSGPNFTFQNISNIQPAKGGAGTQVTIDGEGFDALPANNIVSFNGVAAVVVSATGNQLVVTAPGGVTTGSVSVAINGQRTVGGVFTVVPAPVIKTVSPLSAPAGTTLHITGDYFSNIASEVAVTFNGKPATISAAADKSIAVAVPVGAGKGVIKVLVNGQESLGPVFTEQNLGIAQLLPDNGLAGDDITIKGIGFSATAAENMVNFNGIAATIISASATEIKVTVPPNVTTGAITITANGLQATGPVFKRAGVITLAGGPTKNELGWVMGLAADRQGNVFATDGNQIKKVTPSGAISVFAGQTSGGKEDGNGTNATFNFPTALAIDNNDNLYVCDRLNKRIRKITPAGLVSTVAIVTFTPTALATDKNNGLYVGAQYGGVYKVSATGVATSIAPAYETPGYICVDDAGVVYYAADSYDYNTIFKITGGLRTTHAGRSYGFADGTLSAAMFQQPIGLAIDANNTIYTSDANAIRAVADGNVTTLIGTKGTTTPFTGYANGSFNTALFSGITYMCIGADGSLYISERFNKTIRKVFFN
jgi:hypothetical protein